MTKRVKPYMNVISLVILILARERKLLAYGNIKLPTGYFISSYEILISYNAAHK